MPTVIVVEALPGPRWNATTPDGVCHVDLTADEANRLAWTWRATLVTPERAARYEATKARCLELANGLLPRYQYVADDERDVVPREGVLTPDTLQRYLAANGIPGCRVMLDRNTLSIDPPLPQMLFSPRLSVASK